VGISIKVLNDTVMLVTLVLGGTVAIAAFLWLATFSRREISRICFNWLVGGVFCVVIYLLLALTLSLGSLAVAFLLILIAGLLLLSLGPSHEKLHRWMFYVVWLYFWIAGFIGWRSGWLGLLFVTLPALLVAGLGLFFVAGFLLPFPKPDLYRGARPERPTGGIQIPTFRQELEDFFDLLRYPENRAALKQQIEQHRKALRCLLTYTLGTNYAYYVVIDEKIAARTEGSRAWLTEEEKLIQRLGGDPFREFLAGPGIVLTGCDHAVAISTGIRFKGARGPGVVFIGMSERPTAVDLRVQLRAFKVQARTKDGIDIEVVTFVPFQIGTGRERPELGKGFPYRASAVFKALHSQQVEHSDPSQTPEALKKLAWYDLPEAAGRRIVREIISRYEFDELYAPFELHADPARDPRAQIGKELREELERVLPEWGIQRIGSGISNLVPADERVIEQRIEAWRAGWAREIMLKQAAGQSTRLRLVEQARAQAQIDIILAISERIEQLRATGADGIARHFIGILEGLAEKTALRQLLPRDTNNVIRRARGMVGEGTVGIEQG